jgi:Recombination endonuclease VII
MIALHCDFCYASLWRSDKDVEKKNVFCNHTCQSAFRRRKVELIEGRKVCAKCGMSKLPEEFYRVSKTVSGLGAYCRVCDRERTKAYHRRKAVTHPGQAYAVAVKARLVREYGITLDDYNRILASQGGGCAICEDVVGATRRPRLYVDHCHETNTVRGILCHRCNVALGLMADSPDLLRIAAKYIEDFKARSSMQGAILKLTEEDR